MIAMMVLASLVLASVMLITVMKKNRQEFLLGSASDGMYDELDIFDRLDKPAQAPSVRSG